MRRRSHAARAARVAVLAFSALSASLAASVDASAREGPITEIVLAPDDPWTILVPEPIRGSAFSGERAERLAMLDRRLTELAAAYDRSDVVAIAMRYLGVPYRWGGASASGFDCSGLIMYVYAQVGVPLPHNAAAQYAYGTPVERSQLRPGDLVFFHGLGHAGIYVGDGEFVHAPHSGDVVKVSRMTGWYATHLVGARRL